MLSSVLRRTVGSVRSLAARGVVRQPTVRTFSVLGPRFGGEWRFQFFMV